MSSKVIDTTLPPGDDAAPPGDSAIAGTGSLSSPIVNTLSRFPRRPMPYGPVPPGRVAVAPGSATIIPAPIIPTGGSCIAVGFGDSGADDARG
jgi:hypothetical protein